MVVIKARLVGRLRKRNKGGVVNKRDKRKRGIRGSENRTTQFVFSRSAPCSIPIEVDDEHWGIPKKLKGNKDGRRKEREGQKLQTARVEGRAYWKGGVLQFMRSLVSRLREIPIGNQKSFERRKRRKKSSVTGRKGKGRTKYNVPSPA